MTNKKDEIISIVKGMCMLTGLDTEPNFEIKNEEDLILYLKEIKNQLPKKRLIDDYQVKIISGLY